MPIGLLKVSRLFQISSMFSNEKGRILCRGKQCFVARVGLRCSISANVLSDSYELYSTAKLMRFYTAVSLLFNFRGVNSWPTGFVCSSHGTLTLVGFRFDWHYRSSAVSKGERRK